MITALWSFRKCKDNISRNDLILPTASVVMWKRLHPEHKTKIYLDAAFMAEFEQFQILQLWDEYELLPSRDDINTSHFWSLSKFEALQNESGKVVHVDGDLIPFIDLNDVNFFEKELGVSLLEEITESDDIAYMKPAESAKFGGLDANMYEWDDFADQTSLLYFNNDKFKSEFLDVVFEYMKTASTKKIKHPLGYILFIEQKLFREMAKERDITKKYLIKDGYKVSTGTSLSDLTNGELSLKNVMDNVIHYGPAKNQYSSDLDMAVHLAQFIIPSIGYEYSDLFWNMYYNKPHIEPAKKGGLLSKIGL